MVGLSVTIRIRSQVTNCFADCHIIDKVTPRTKPRRNRGEVISLKVPQLGRGSFNGSGSADQLTVQEAPINRGNRTDHHPLDGFRLRATRVGNPVSDFVNVRQQCHSVLASVLLSVLDIHV